MSEDISVYDESQEKEATMLLKHIKELALLKYDNEEKREQSLVQQSSQMQTAFSFVSAAVFMIVPVLIQNRGPLSINFFLVSLSSITLFLLISLSIASLAQWRWKTHTFPDVDEIYSFVKDNWEDSNTEAKQLKQWIDLIGKVQKEKAKNNDRRVLLIMHSMVSFHIALILIFIWSLIGLFKTL